MRYLLLLLLFPLSLNAQHWGSQLIVHKTPSAPSGDTTTTNLIVQYLDFDNAGFSVITSECAGTPASSGDSIYYTLTNIVTDSVRSFGGAFGDNLTQADSQALADVGLLNALIPTLEYQAITNLTKTFSDTIVISAYMEVNGCVGQTVVDTMYTGEAVFVASVAYPNTASSCFSQYSSTNFSISSRATDTSLPTAGLRFSANNDIDSSSAFNVWYGDVSINEGAYSTTSDFVNPAATDTVDIIIGFANGDTCTARYYGGAANTNVFAAWTYGLTLSTFNESAQTCGIFVTRINGSSGSKTMASCTDSTGLYLVITNPDLTTQEINSGSGHGLTCTGNLANQTYTIDVSQIGLYKIETFLTATDGFVANHVAYIRRTQ